MRSELARDLKRQAVIEKLPDDGSTWKCGNCYGDNPYHPASNVRGVTCPNGTKIVLCMDCLKEAGYKAA